MFLKHCIHIDSSCNIAPLILPLPRTLESFYNSKCKHWGQIVKYDLEIYNNISKDIVNNFLLTSLRVAKRNLFTRISCFSLICPQIIHQEFATELVSTIICVLGSHSLTSIRYEFLYSTATDIIRNTSVNIQYERYAYYYRLITGLLQSEGDG